MIYTYEECKQKYKTDYELRKKLQSGDLVRIDRGLYSDEVIESELAVVGKKYPNAVFTMNSAFYYHELTDVIPQYFYLITDKDAAKIKNPAVVQFFDNCDSLELGQITMNRNGTDIRIFNRERLLIELIRNKNKLPFDYYKEIISSYRRLIWEMDVQAVQDYAIKLPKTRLVMNTLQMEVF